MEHPWVVMLPPMAFGYMLWPSELQFIKGSLHCSTYIQVPEIFFQGKKSQDLSGN